MMSGIMVDYLKIIYYLKLKRLGLKKNRVLLLSRGLLSSCDTNFCKVVVLTTKMITPEDNLSMVVWKDETGLAVYPSWSEKTKVPHGLPTERAQMELRVRAQSTTLLNDAASRSSIVFHINRFYSKLSPLRFLVPFDLKPPLEFKPL